jgi:hypothetical protein
MSALKKTPRKENMAKVPSSTWKDALKKPKLVFTLTSLFFTSVLGFKKKDSR